MCEAGLSYKKNSKMSEMFDCGLFVFLIIMRYETKNAHSYILVKVKKHNAFHLFDFINCFWKNLKC